MMSYLFKRYSTNERQQNDENKEAEKVKWHGRQWDDSLCCKMNQIIHIDLGATCTTEDFFWAN